MTQMIDISLNEYIKASITTTLIDIKTHLFIFGVLSVKHIQLNSVWLGFAKPIVSQLFVLIFNHLLNLY